MNKQPITRRALLAGLAGAALLTCGAFRPSAAAPKPPQPISGAYVGTIEGETPEQSENVRLVINEPNKRKLTAQLFSTDDPALPPIDLKGTLSASGQVSLLGKVEGRRVMVKGKWTDADAVANTGRTLVGRFKLTGNEGMKGTFTLVDELFVPPAP
jgi:hypothetical protein